MELQYFKLRMQMIYITCLLLTTNHNVRSEILLNGSLTVAGLFQIQKAINDKCEGIVPFSVKTVEAVKWTFRKLNENNYIPDVSIGLDVWPTCQLVDLAMDTAIDVVNRIREDKTDQAYTRPPLTAMIGPGFSSEAQQISYLFSSQRSEDQLLQLGFSTTAASLSNNDIYSNFFRVVPSDKTQIEVMISLMTEIHWNYIAVIYDNDVYGKECKNSLVARAADASICIGASFSIPSGAVSLTDLRNILLSIIQHSESPISGVVVFTNPSHVEAIISAATAMKTDFSDPLSFIFSEAIGTSDNYFRDINGDLYNAAKGAFTVSPPQITIKEFEEYWSGMFQNVSQLVVESGTNQWLRSVYQEYSGCLPSTNPSNPMCPELNSAQKVSATQSYSWTSYAVKAAYVVAKVVKNAHDRLCNGQQGLCLSMKDMLYKNKGSLVQEMDGLTIDFKTNFPFVPEALSNISLDFFGGNDAAYKEGFPDYEIYQYTACIPDQSSFCFEKIGFYNNTALSLDTSHIKDYQSNTNGDRWPNINYAQCKEGRRCSSCIRKEVYEDIYFKDGDLIVGGIVPVYDGDTKDPLSCSVIRTSLGTELVQAMEYAVDLINNKTHPYENVFPGIKVGLLVINSCNQPLLIKHKLLSVLHDGLPMDNNQTLNVRDKLIGFVGAYSSSLSIAASDVLSKFNYVQVAYASTAVELKDRKKYPFFARVSTPDDKQIRAMIQIIKHSYYSSDYIQVLYSKGTYGEAGRDAIRAETKVNGICIANELEVDDGDNHNAILDKLRIYSFAKIVIVFLRSHQIEEVTLALNNRMQYGEFLYIGSEAWGYRPDKFNSQQKLAGSIVLSLQMPQNENFTTYLNNIDVLKESANPWLLEYIASKFSCHVATSFDKTFTQLCDNNLRLADSDSYKQEIWTPFAMNAMIAMLSGSSEAFRELCGSSSSTLCEQFMRSPSAIKDKIIHKELDIDGSGNTFRLFDNNGDGNVGYTIYNLQPKKEDTTQIVYEKVGDFPIDGRQFVLDTTKIVLPYGINLPSVCPNDLACSLCRPSSENSTVLKTSDTDIDSAIPALAVIVGILIVALVILTVVFVLYCRRLKDYERKDKENYNYLNVIDVPDPTFYQVRNNTNENHNQVTCTINNALTNTHQEEVPAINASYLDPRSLVEDKYTAPYDEQSVSNNSNTLPKRIDSVRMTSNPVLQEENTNPVLESISLPSVHQTSVNTLEPISSSDKKDQVTNNQSETPPLAPSNRKTKVAIVSGVQKQSGFYN